MWIRMDTSNPLWGGSLLEELDPIAFGFLDDRVVGRNLWLA